MKTKKIILLAIQLLIGVPGLILVWINTNGWVALGVMLMMWANNIDQANRRGEIL